MAGNEQAARFEAIIGATGSGKSHELKRRLKLRKRRRILCWSPKEIIDNYAAFLDGATVCRTTSEVLKIVGGAGKRGAFCVVFVPTLSRKADEAAFNVFCKIALAAGNLTMIVEEVHSVTTPSRAVDGWAKLNFMGRGYGVEVFGLSQRPASVDKAFMGSLSFCHCGRLPYPEDQKTMAKTLGITAAELARLTGFDAIQKNFVTGEICRVGRSAQRVA